MFTDWLTEELKKREWSHSELARRSGLSQVSVSGVISGSRPASCEFCIKVAAALDASPERLLKLAGFLPGDITDEDDIQQLVNIARLLSPDKREELIRFARSLRG